VLVFAFTLEESDLDLLACIHRSIIEQPAQSLQPLCFMQEVNTCFLQVKSQLIHYRRLSSA